MNIIYFCSEKKHDICYPNILDLQKKGYDIKIEEISSDDPYGYWKAISKYWGQSALITIEHDHLVSSEMLDSLMACKERACCYYYPTSIEREYLNIGIRLADPTYNILFNRKDFEQIKPKIKYVTFTGMGLTKIDSYYQTYPIEKFGVRNNPKFPKDGINVDNAIIKTINSWLPGMAKFHIHGEVPHLNPVLMDEELYAHRYDAYAERDCK